MAAAPPGGAAVESMAAAPPDDAAAEADGSDYGSDADGDFLPVLEAPLPTAPGGPRTPHGPAAPDDEGGFDDIFAMMLGQWPTGGTNTAAEEQEGSAKRRRTSPPPVGPPSPQPAGAAPAAGAPSGGRRELPGVEVDSAGCPEVEASAENALVQHRGSRDRPLRKVPDKVIAAYATLDLSLTATVREVERKSRRLSRRAHPDKVSPKLQLRAARHFREVQDAKATVLAWLRDQEAYSGDGSEDSSADVAGSGEDGPASDGNWEHALGDEGVDPGGDTASDEEPENTRACNLPRPDADPDSDDASGGEGRGAADALRMVVAGKTRISAGDGVLDQASALSRHFAAAAPQWRTCNECMQRQALKGSTMCKPCRLVQERAWRRLIK